MILISCNSKEYLDEIGYVSPTDVLDIIPILYGMEMIKVQDINEKILSKELTNIVQTKSLEYFYSNVHPYSKLNGLDQVIVFYITGNEDIELKDVVFCIICDLKYDKNQLLTLMKRYSKLRAFV